MGCKTHSWSIWKKKRHSGEGPRHEVREVISELNLKGKVGVCQTDGRKLLKAKGINIPRERQHGGFEKWRISLYPRVSGKN